MISCFAVILLLSGCSSVDIDSGKLSDKDKITIIDMARYAITGNEKNKKFVTAEERDKINREMPIVKIHYTGYREGQMIMSWELAKKTINFKYSGKFLTDSAMWQMRITKHDYSVSKDKKDPFRARTKAMPKDFEGLLKEDKMMVRPQSK
jgi:hypothetical protein